METSNIHRSAFEISSLKDEFHERDYWKVLPTISGVDCPTCYAGRREEELNKIPVCLVALDDLKRNKRASGRLKDQVDLQQLG